MTNSFTINDINDYCEVINEIKSFVQKRFVNEKPNPTLWYRGQANLSWKLIPSIQRTSSLKNKEHIFCTSFYHRASQILNPKIPKDSYAEWIPLMQHYGLPTRLLDWSYSPLVALYFATFDEENSIYDGNVTIIVPEIINLLNGLKAYIYPIDSNHANKLLECAFYAKKNNGTNSRSIIACFPISNEIRIYAQRAGFTLHGPDSSFENIKEKNCIFNLIIPSNRKLYFKDILNILDFQESFLFPDLTHIAQQVLKRHQ